MDLDKHLIREVKSHAVLYDSNHSKYKDIDFKQQTWIEIGRKLIGTEDDATSVNALKVRWKSLRDAYVKERKYDISKSCGIKVKAKKPWRLKKQMEFLAPFIQNRKELTADTPKDSKPENHCSEENSNNTQKARSSDSNRCNGSKKDEEHDSSINFNYRFNLAKRYESPRPEHKVKEIESFFRGISDAVMGLNKKNQILVQKEIAALVMNYKLKELEKEEEQNGNS